MIGSIEWDFVEKKMLTLGFHEGWILLIKKCIKSVTYSVVINGEPKVTLFHQGKSVKKSPYHHTSFLHVHKVFLCWEQLHAVDGSLYGLSIYSRGPKLSHLFLADRSLMYCEATMEDCTQIWKLSWHNINKQQDKRSTWINLPFTLSKAVMMAPKRL